MYVLKLASNVVNMNARDLNLIVLLHVEFMNID